MLLGENKKMYKLLSDFFNENLSLFQIQSGIMTDVDKYDLFLQVNQLIDIPFKKYIQFLNSFSEIDRSIASADIIQFSNFQDVTVNLSKTLVLAGNSGFTFEEVGSYLLRNVESKNNKGSNTKYGENHLKAGKILGLSNNRNHKWYLTKFGYIFGELTIDQQEKMLSRLALKTKLISSVVYDALRKDVYINDYISILSDSTKVRRRSNIKKLFFLIRNNNEYSIDYIIDSINGGGYI